MDSPSPTNNRCLVICDNTFLRKSNKIHTSVENVDIVTKTNNLNVMKHPGQAVKIIYNKSDIKGEHKIIRETSKGSEEVCKYEEQDIKLKISKSCCDFKEIKKSFKVSKSNTDLKNYKTCDENLIKFIFTKHGIQVISDVETIV